MTENSQNRVAWPVAYGLAPRKGSRAMPQSLDFTLESPVGINLTFEQDSERLEFVQALFVDNSGNSNSLTCAMRGTGQVIIVPGTSQAYIPVLATADNCKMSFSTTGTPVVPIFFLSFPVPLAIWSTASGGLSVSTAANTSGGASTYAALGGTGNALLTNTATAVKTSAGNLYGLNLVNTGNAVAYVQFFDVAAASVTPGTTIPKLSFWVPVGAWEEKFTGEAKIAFATAITCLAATTATGGTAPGTGILANIVFK